MDKEEYIEVRDNSDGIEKLMAAARSGDVGCIKELIESGIDIEARNRYHQTALMVAAESGQPECIEALVKLNADIEAADYDTGETALILAARSDQVECIEKLLNLGAYIDVKGSSGKFLLMVAIKNGQVSCIEKLVKLGANIEAKDQYGKTVLMYAAQCEHAECIEKLVKLGADIEDKDNKGQTALMVAAQYGQVKCIQKLVDLEANIGVKDKRGKTVLMVAAGYGHVECIEKLVELGVDIEAKDKDGKTALMIAVAIFLPLQEDWIEKQGECIKKLIKLGADIDARDKYSKTVLMYAVEYGSIGAFQLLLTKGADIAVKDNNNKTAIAYFYLDHGEDGLVRFINFIRCIYENCMNLNEAIINQIRVHLDSHYASYHHGESENYIKVNMFLFQIKSSLDLSTKFNNISNIVLTTGRELFVEARDCRIQRVIAFWRQQKWHRELCKTFLMAMKRGEKKLNRLSLPAEMMEKVLSLFLPRYLEGNIIFSKDILDASGGVIGAEGCSVMVTSYHCQESADEVEKLLRQEEKPEKKNIS